MKHLTQAESLKIDRSILEKGLIGIERETHRLKEGKISEEAHPKVLGNKLYNQFITTDFAESQIEFITPPFSDKEDVIRFLHDLNLFFYQNVNESLWPLSMPPFIENEDSISLADFGDSNEGLFKNIYRKGLANRYGKHMQCISGIHFNYSFSENTFSFLSENHDLQDDQKFRSDIYFKTMRNINRYNWLLLYFFGASPLVSENFAQLKDDISFLKSDAYYLPYATSLRMSDVGYQSANQSKLFVSLNSLDDYCSDLYNLTSMPFQQYQILKQESNNEYTQLNQNLLQIEAEYYTSCRPKPQSTKGSRLTSALFKQGVHYIELRSLDLNPFSMIGIDRITLDFLEIFMIFCCLDESPFISRKEMIEIKRNDLSVAKNGRQLGISIIDKNREIPLKDAGMRILEKMAEISILLGHEDSLIQKYVSQIHDPSLTLSGRLLDQFRELEGGLDEFGFKIATTNQKQYLGLDYKVSENKALIADEAEFSQRHANDLDQNVNFNSYLEAYFKS